ncbi:MAG: hypothetical protein LBW77_05780 [Verrucomicrobiota bacterium]|jgi:hypothetical protein|nr:hypothetical protein [Verrucomicrobiota bacterium]
MSNFLDPNDPANAKFNEVRRQGLDLLNKGIAYAKANPKHALYAGIGVLVLLSLLGRGCGCGGARRHSAASPATAHAPRSERGGSDATAGVIEFHNNLLEFRKKATGPLKKIVSLIKDSQGFIERDTISGERPMWNHAFIGSSPYDSLAKVRMDPPASLDKKDRAFFTERVKTIKEGTAALAAHIGTLIAYYQAEDYKDDKHKKFLDLRPELEKLVNAVAAASEEAGDLSEKLADAEERKTLAKNPVGVYILTMRDINAKADAQLELLMDDRLLLQGSGTENRTDAEKAEAVAKVKDILDKADALTADIDKLVKAGRKVDLAVIEKRPPLDAKFQSFFKAVESQQGEVRKNLRFAREWGHIGNEGSLRLLGETGKSLWSAHNSFIESLNSGH